MKITFALLLLIFIGCSDSGVKKKQEIKKPEIDYARTYAVILCDSSVNEYAISVGNKYILQTEFKMRDGSVVYFGTGGVYRGFDLTYQIGEEQTYPSYDSAMKIKKKWDRMVDDYKKQDIINAIEQKKYDSIEKLRHKYKPCK